MKVVLLAGGYGERLAQDIQQATNAPQHVESKLSARQQLLRHPDNESYVPLGLVTVSGVSVLTAWLTALKYCSRVAPAADNVYVVCNEADRQEFTEPGGFLDT